MKNILISCLLLAGFTLQAQDIILPAPQKTGGEPLMEVLAARKSARQFADRALPMSELSNLLWAADGINREDGRRTAPTARNMQQIDIYIFIPEGIYLYDHTRHQLKQVRKGDYRADIALGDFAKKAPLLLVYVANYDKMQGMPQEAMDLYGATDCGNISQNVYLYCTSAKLNTVAIGSINKDKIKELAGFGNCKAILGQPVGYPE